MIRYAIVDDEPIAHRIIEEFAAELQTLIKVGNCYNAFEALRLLQEQKVDLFFLDINMPKLSGFEFLRTLSNPPKIIVTSAYKDYAIEGYELKIVDYLLKPFSFERFLKAANSVTDFREAPSGTEQENFLTVKVNKKLYRVKLKDLLFIEAQGNYCKVVTSEESLLTLRKISDFEKSLPDAFVRVHNSFLVAKDKIKATEGNSLLIAQHLIPVGKTYRKILKSL